MYHYSKIKDVITIYNQREIYHMNVINILQLFKIARSTLYEWIRNFSDILHGVTNKKVIDYPI